LEVLSSYQPLSPANTDAVSRHVRRPAHLSEIEAITGADRVTVKIIERFRSGGRSFLIVTNDDDPRIDISHESLIRQWESARSHHLFE